MSVNNTKQQARTLPLLAFSLKELSKSWGVSVRKLRKETQTGQLPHVRIGRRILVTAEQAEQYLARHSR